MTLYSTTITPAAIDQHGLEAPSSWVQRWAHLATPGGTVLDVACGRGRHARWLATHGHALTVIDRSAEALDAIHLPGCEKVLADIEANAWPMPERQFDVVVVTNYLWRPLMPALLASLAPGGVLIYETFADGNETVGKPSRPDFLLRPGELLAVCAGLRIVAFEDGFELAKGASTLALRERFVQRIAAVNNAKAHSGPSPVRYPLQAPAQAQP